MKLSIVLILMLIVSSGCGSGGGGGGGSDDNDNGIVIPNPNVSNISYNGLTTQAVTTKDNAAYIAFGALQGGFPGTGYSGLNTAHVNIQLKPNRPRLLILLTTLEKSAKKPVPPDIVASAVHSNFWTEKGDCGGVAYFTTDYDDVSGNVWGSETYDGYCSNGVTLAGKVNFSGKINIYRTYDQLRFSFNPLYTTYQGDTFITQGSIDYDYTVTPVAANVNLLLDCNCSGKIYKYENFGMNITDGPGYMDFEMNGKFYEPDYGYVDISTEAIFRINDADIWPSYGKFILKGSSGTSARLVIVSAAEYAVEADTDGDGQYDWSKIVGWDEDPGAGHPDQSAPAVPGGLTASALSDSEIRLVWSTPADNVGIAGYKVYRDGAYLNTAAKTSFSDAGLNYYTYHCYSVSAFDVAGNESAQSSQSCDWTMKVPLSLFPQAPADFTAKSYSHHRIKLSWTEKRGINISGYKIYRNGLYLKSVSPLSTSTDDMELNMDTQYCYTVTAYDAILETAESSQSCATTDDAIDTNDLFIGRFSAVKNMYGKGVLGDLDSDGDLDAFVACLNNSNRVYINDGSAVFSDSGQLLGGIRNNTSYDAALGDLDGDGDLDAFIANNNGVHNTVWINDGNAFFSDSGQTLGNNSSSGVVLGDLDGDGDLDAFVANFGSNKIWINNGNAVFSDSGQSIGNTVSKGAALGDLDGDGDLDIFVANVTLNKIWINDGLGNFSDSGQALGDGTTYSNGIALADLDGDGDLDAFVANNNVDNVWFNDGSAFFTNSGQNFSSSPSKGIKLGDLDGDGDYDAFVSGFNAMSIVRINGGSGVFNGGGQGLGSYDNKSYGVDLGDLDGDGDLDVLDVSGDNPLWINTSK